MDFSLDIYPRYYMFLLIGPVLNLRAVKKHCLIKIWTYPHGPVLMLLTHLTRGKLSNQRYINQYTSLYRCLSSIMIVHCSVLSTFTKYPVTYQTTLVDQFHAQMSTQNKLEWRLAVCSVWHVTSPAISGITRFFPTRPIASHGFPQAAIQCLNIRSE